MWIAAGLAVVVLAGGAAYAYRESRARRAAAVARAEGIAAFRKFDFAATAKLLTQAAPYYKKDVELHYVLGIARYNLKDYDGAIAAYRAVLAVQPKHATAYNNMGNVYRDKGDYPSAIAAYRAAIAANSGLTSAYVGLATIYLFRGELPAELEAWALGVKTNPDDVTLRLFYGEALERAGAGRKADALAQYQAVLERQPGNAEALAAVKRLGK
jgi:tetratricopeptide (TPR) repeat protein